MATKGPDPTLVGDKYRQPLGKPRSLSRAMGLLAGIGCWRQPRGELLLTLAVVLGVTYFIAGVSLAGRPGSYSSSARRFGVGGAAWENAPPVSLSARVPAWAGCPQSPCLYNELTDGPVNTSVSVEGTLCNV